MGAYFPGRWVISIARFLEHLLLLTWLLILCSQTALLVAAVTGRPFRMEEYGGPWHKLFLLLCTISLLEVLLTVMQRILIRAADPYRLEAVVSSEQALLRLGGTFFFGILWMVFSWGFHFLAKRWLGEAYLPNSWGSRLDVMYFQIFFTSMLAKLLHWKLWSAVAL